MRKLPLVWRLARLGRSLENPIALVEGLAETGLVSGSLSGSAETVAADGPLFSVMGHSLSLSVASSKRGARHDWRQLKQGIEQGATVHNECKKGRVGRQGAQNPRVGQHTVTDVEQAPHLVGRCSAFSAIQRYIAALYRPLDLVTSFEQRLQDERS